MNNSTCKILRLILTLLVVSGCASNSQQLDTFSETRQSIALTLENDQNYYAALNQWKILQTVYPNDTKIEDEIERINTIIEDKIKRLSNSLAASNHHNNNFQIQNFSLKILALDPDNKTALQALRNIEQSNAYKTATNKTKSIKKYFTDNQLKAERSIKTSLYIAQAKQLNLKRKQQQLLTLSNQILQKYPRFKEALHYKYKILTSFGKSKLDKNELEEALLFYKQALSLKITANQTIVSQVNALKIKLSNQYYKKAMDVFKSNIAKTIELLETSLSYNPNNVKAAQQLNRVIRIQKKLQQISNMSKG